MWQFRLFSLLCKVWTEDWVKYSGVLIPTINIPSLVQIIASGPPGDKPWSEPMMVSLLTHICVIRPQWVNMTCVSDTFRLANQMRIRTHIFLMPGSLRNWSIFKIHHRYPCSFTGESEITVTDILLIIMSSYMPNKHEHISPILQNITEFYSLDSNWKSKWHMFSSCLHDIYIFDVNAITLLMYELSIAS